MSLTLFGDWAKALTMASSMERRFRVAAKAAVMREAQLFRTQVVKGLRNQAPGGEAIKPLSPLTLAIRALLGFKGTKALIRRGDLLNNIVAQSVPGDIPGAFVGVLRTARNTAGEDLVKIAEMNEFGSGPILIPITPKSSRFFHLALARAGIDPHSTGQGGGGGLNIAIVKIPARPFLQPAFDVYAKPDDIRARFYKTLDDAMFRV